MSRCEFVLTTCCLVMMGQYDLARAWYDGFQKCKLTTFLSLFICWFVITKPKNPHFASRRGLEVKPWECNHSDCVVLLAVLPKVHHRPEPLFPPTEVKTAHFDGLARIPGLTQAPYKSHPQPMTSESRYLPRLIPLTTNTQDSLVPEVPTLKGVRVRTLERGRGQPMNDFGR